MLLIILSKLYRKLALNYYVQILIKTFRVSIDEFFGDDLLGENVLDTSENAIQLKLRGKCPKCKR